MVKVLDREVPTAALAAGLVVAPLALRAAARAVAGYACRFSARCFLSLVEPPRVELAGRSLAREAPGR